MQRLQEVILRTSTGPLRPLWKVGYAVLRRVIAACLRRASPQTTVYVGGSFGFGEPVYGLSDLDVIAVSPDDPSAIRLRWRRLVDRLPVLAHVARDVFVYGEDELRRADCGAVLELRGDVPAARRRARRSGPDRAARAVRGDARVAAGCRAGATPARGIRRAEPAPGRLARAAVLVALRLSGRRHARRRRTSRSSA